MGICQSKKEKSTKNDSPKKTITQASEIVINKSDFITKNDGKVKFRDSY